jgi:acylaminoacyl-peptidase
VQNIPDTTTITLGQPIFCPSYITNSDTNHGESIVYTGWEHLTLSKRLGLIYCQQRPCKLYHSKISNLILDLSTIDTATTAKVPDPPYITLTHDMKLAHSPRFTPMDKDNRIKCNLVFLTSHHGFDTHSGCFALGKIDFTNMNQLYSDSSGGEVPEIQIVVDEVWDPTTSSPLINGSSNNDYKYYGMVANLSFPGLFLQQLPDSCFLSSEYLLTTTQWGSCQKVICISITTGSVNLIEIDGCHPYASNEMICCNNDGIVICTKTPVTPATLHYVKVDQLLHDATISSDGQPILVSSSMISTMTPIASSKIAPVASVSKLTSTFDFDIHVIPTPRVDGVDCNNAIQSILLLPKQQNNKSNLSSLPPLIVVPHGGPHSVSSTNFVTSYAYLCGYGRFAILLVNYHGSTGFGQASIMALPKNIGTLDVQDVIAATQRVCNSGLVDIHHIGICGGSHGGFITAHLIGQYPNMFQAAVMRNPVVNLPSMVTSTDIPDWCYVEACGSYNFSSYRPPTMEEIQTFYNVSPIQYVQQVKTPTLVALGLKDLRVPPSQGLEWYHSLCNLNKELPMRLLLYENDDHAIDGVASDADHWVHIQQWFNKYL